MMNGIINFNKPTNMTSHQAVAFFRKLLNIKKIGHTGTLDPNATGVLPICIGKSTRVSEYLLLADKEYVAELELGNATDTQDADGSIIKTSDKSVSEQEIVNVFNSFQGEIEQIPPMYSALKHKGKKLYELAREGIEIERKPRKANIYEMKILEIIDNKKIKFYVKCSRGTYIRTICNDIGENLETYGFMSKLERVGVSNFKINDSITKEELEKMSREEIVNILYPIDYALENFEKIDLESKHFKMVTNGMKIKLEKKYCQDTLYRVYCEKKFIGIGKAVEKEDEFFLKMDKVFI